MHLSREQKNVCQIFTAFLKCKSNFEHSEKKDEPNSLIISQIIDYERRAYLNV